jgi:hypothetical protein
MLSQVCAMMIAKKHLTLDGMTRIINLVFDTPIKKANRQFSKSELLYVLGDQAKVADLIARRRKMRQQNRN